MLHLFLLGSFAFFVTLLLTPGVRCLSLRLGLFDKSDNNRKIHLGKIPRVGGISIFIPYIFTVCYLSMPALHQDQALLQKLRAPWLFLCSVSMIFVTGLLDDLVGLKPLHKLLCGSLAALLAWCSGIQVHIPPADSQDSLISLLVTVFWLLLCTNAFNLIDGLDGLATGAGLFAAIAMLVSSIMDQDVVLAAITLPLIGSLVGFLKYNFNPASIFLGDSGSLLIGVGA